MTVPWRRPAPPAEGERVVATAESDTDTIVEESVDYRLDEGDHERFSHYVPKDKLMQGNGRGHSGARAVREIVGALTRPQALPGMSGLQANLRPVPE